MSTDQSPDTEDRPGREPRRRQLTAVGVATAVLLAGGGGAYWASTATSGSKDDAGGADKRPPALALDGRQASTDAERGIAPGEPMGPRGYRATGDLPDGPDTAAVHRPAHKVSASDVAKLATSLKLKGDPREKADAWEVAPKGSDARLSARADEPGGTWTFVDRDGVTGGCDLPVPQAPDSARHKDLPGTPAHTACAQAPEAKDGAGGTSTKDDKDGGSAAKAVSAAEAKDAVRPVLGALGLKDASLRAGSPVDGQRTVTISPRVDGLPTHGWDSTLTVDADGKPVRGAGSWGRTTKGAEYPVATADATLNELNKADQKHGGATTERSGSGPRVQTGGPEEPGRTGSTDKGGKKDAAKVTGAAFGLSLKRSHGDPVLVPSWIYDVKPSGATALKVAHPAVEAKFLKSTGSASGEGSGPGVGVPAPSDGRSSESAPAKKPGAPSQGGGDVGAGGGGAESPSQAVESYENEGRTLRISFWGGVCDTYKATADESGAKVKVRVAAEKSEDKKVCVKIAKRQTVEVKLDKALGDRKVVDARDGDALPRT